MSEILLGEDNKLKRDRLSRRLERKGQDAITTRAEERMVIARAYPN